MRRLWYIPLTLVLALLAGGLSLWQLSRTDFFWRWGGERLVEMARDRVRGELTIRSLGGNPLTGLYFEDITLKDDQGPVFRAERLELRFSIWSFIKLQPVIAQLTLRRPHLNLIQDPQGNWNAARLLKPRPPPPFTSLDFPGIRVEAGRLDLSRPGSAQTYEDLDLQGSITVTHPKQPQQTLSVRHLKLAAATPWGRFTLTTSLNYSGDGLELKSLTAQAGDQTLFTLAGETRLGDAGPVLDLAGEIHPAAAGELNRIWPRWPAGDLEGKFRLMGSPSQLRLTGEGGWQKAKYQLQAGCRRPAGEWEYDLQLNLTDFPPQTLTALYPPLEKQLQGLSPLTARLALQGEGLTWPPVRVSGSLECSPFRYQGAEFQDFKLNLAGDPRQQRLEALARGNFGKMNLTAAGPIITSRAGDLKIQVQDLKPDVLGLPQLSKSLLTGKFAGTFNLAALRVAGEVEAQGQLYQQPLKELRARLAWDGARLEVPQAKVRLGTLDAQLKGRLEPKGLDLQYRGSLTADGAFPWLPQDWRGRLEGEGNLKGPFNALQYSFQGKGQGLSGEGLALESAGIKVQGTAWPPRSGRLEAQGAGWKTPLGVFSKAGLTSHGDAGRWTFGFHGSAPGLQAELSGGADYQDRSLALRLDRCRLKTPQVSLSNLGVVRLRVHPGWEIGPAGFRVNDGSLTLQAQAREGRLSGRVELCDLPTDLLSLKGGLCKGKVRGVMTIGGLPSNPLLQGEISWGPGQWGNFAFRSLKTSFNYREARVYLKGGLEESEPGPKISWEGQIPLHLSFLPLKWSLGDRDLNFRVQGEKANLALLTALTPEIPKAQGSLDVQAQWQGNPRRPMLSGQLRWGEGAITFRQAGLPYQLLPGQARLQGEKILVPEIIFKSGGVARLSGEITLSGLIPQRVEARAHLQDFITLRRAGSEATGNGDLTLMGPWTSPTLKGHLTIPRATFNPGFFRSEKHEDVILVKPPPPPPKNGQAAISYPFYRNLNMDLDIEAPGGVWLKDKRLIAEFAGKVKAKKRTGQTAYWGGTVKTLRGTYELQGRSFKVENGVIRLPGAPKADATLEAQATHETGGITLKLVATGPVAKPQVRLESIPPLPPPDLLSYLVFGRPAGRLSRDEYLSVGQQAVGILGGITAEKIKEMLGKDVPLVGNLTLRTPQTENRQAVGVAKPLTKDLTVSFERKIDPLHRDQTEQVVIEYKLNKYMSVESQVGRRNTGGDVLFNLDF